MHHPREAGHEARGVSRRRGGPQARRPLPRDRRRRLLRRGAARTHLRALSLRRRRVRAGIDRASRRVARRRWGGCRAREFRARPALVRGNPADAPRALVPGVGPGLDGVQLGLLVLHRPGGTRTGGLSASWRGDRRGHAPRPRGREGGHAAGSERQLVGARSAARPAHRVWRAAPRRRPRGGHRTHPLHEPTSEGLSRAGDRGDRGLRGGLRARASAAAVRLDAHSQGNAADVLARPVPARSSRSCAQRSRMSRSEPTSSSAFRGRPRPTSARRSRSPPRSVSTARSPSSTPPARGPRRPRCPTRFRTR